MGMGTTLDMIRAVLDHLLPVLLGALAALLLGTPREAEKCPRCGKAGAYSPGLHRYLPVRVCTEGECRCGSGPGFWLALIIGFNGHVFLAPGRSYLGALYASLTEKKEGGGRE